MFKIGDTIIFNKQHMTFCPYSKTNSNMISAKVLDVEGRIIQIKITEHLFKSEFGKEYFVDSRYFVLKNDVDEFLLLE